MTVEFPLDLGSAEVAQLLPHGPGFSFVYSIHVEYDPPNGTHGHLYHVTGRYLVSPVTLTLRQLVEARNGNLDAPLGSNELLGLVLAEHFPGWPVMPGVLLLEMLGQTGAVLLRLNDNAVLRQVKTELELPPNLHEYIGVFTGFDGIRFIRSVEPSDTVEVLFVLDTDRLALGRGQTIVGQGTAEMRIGAKVAVRAEVIHFVAKPPR